MFFKYPLEEVICYTSRYITFSLLYKMTWNTLHNGKW